MAAMLAAGLRPLEAFPGSDKPWLSRHECGREVRPRYKEIQQGQGGCSACGYIKVDLGIVMATMATAGLTPLEPYQGNDVPWPCRHTCGKEVRPRYSNIQQGRGGCRFCASYKYDPTKPARVYLIKFDNHPNFPRGVIKIGIAGGKFRRLDYWRQRGWSFLEVIHFDDGKIPPVVEREVLTWFNDDLGLKPCLSAADLGTRGYTETISVADLVGGGVSVADVRKKVKQLAKKAGG